MGRNLFGAVGALAALAATAVQSGHGAHAQTINENNVRGLHDVTILLGGIQAPSNAAYKPPPCSIVVPTYQSAANYMTFGGTVPIMARGRCTANDIARWQEMLARGARANLGDRGRH